MKIKSKYTGEVILEIANLKFADLRGANLTGADLTDANLKFANLKFANLKFANLTNADLTNADLTNADLTDADLTNTKLPIYSKWAVSYRNKDIIQIGCKTKTVKEWDEWFKGKEVFNTPRNTKDFKRIYANYIAVREYLKILNS